jgi:hypothetical protein
VARARDVLPQMSAVFFFPQTKSLGIDRTELSPQLQRKLVYAGSKNSSFAQGSADLAEYMNFEVDPKQVERVAHRIGLDVVASATRPSTPT